MQKGASNWATRPTNVQQSRRGQVVVVWVDGQKRTLNVYKDKVVIKTLPIKGLQNRTMKFREYLDLMCKEAVSTWRKAQHRAVRYG